MLSRFSLLGIAFLFISVGWLVVKSRIRRQKHVQLAKSLGCEQPFALRNENWIGNSILRESMRANKEDWGPEFIHQKMNSIQCNTVQVPILNFDVLVTRDPENCRVLFSSPDFDISGTRQMSWMPLMGKGIFTSRGEIWKHSRTMLRPQFSKGMNNPTSVEERHISHLVQHFPADAETGWTEPVDLLPLLFKYTLDSATEFIFGKSTESLVSSDSDISQHFDQAKVWIDKRGALSKWYFLLNTREFQENCRAIHKFADTIVYERLAHQAERKTDPEKAQLDSDGDRYNLLSKVAETTQNPRELRNEMLHVLVAGRDTTGCLLAWVLYFLARHPDVFKRLRAAIIDEFGTNTAASDYKQLANITYLQWVISETIRFAAIIPLNERVALRDTTLPRGGGPDGLSKIFVPEGTQVLIPLYSMQRREDLWGPDADQFRPERWENCRPGWEFLPFGAGARKCLGQQFARMEVNYVISRFCQRYDRIDNAEEGDNFLAMHHAIENRPGHGVRVRLHEARAA